MKLDQAILDLVQYAAESRFSISSAALIKAAERRGIQWFRVDEDSIQLGYGRYQRRLCGTQTSETSPIAVDTAADKANTNRILSSLGCPVPTQRVAHTLQEVLWAAETIGYPIVIKPRFGNHGNGVSTGLRTRFQIEAAFHKAKQYNECVVAEANIVGEDFRMLIVNGTFIAASHRVPGHVIGDGLHTIADLVQIATGDPRRSKGHGNVLTSLDSIPRLRTRWNGAATAYGLCRRRGVLFLRLTANLSKVVPRSMSPMRSILTTVTWLSAQ